MKRLLVADDDPGMRAALEARFARRGWQVDSAANGSDACARFRPGLHSLVITDVRMPGSDGFELLRAVRASSAGTAVILLTAYACVPDAVKAMRDGAVDYGKLGDWVEKLGFASEQDVTAALALQWGSPLVSSFNLGVVDTPGSIPLPILEAFQMLPASYAAATRTLYLAFGERVDHAALYAIERTLACRTQACVASRKQIARQLESMHQLSRPGDVEFVTRDLGEMARITSSYVNRLSPQDVRISRIGQFIWLRMKARTAVTNLVFSLESNSNAQRAPSLASLSSSLAAMTYSPVTSSGDSSMPIGG